MSNAESEGHARLPIQREILRWTEQVGEARTRVLRMTAEYVYGTADENAVLAELLTSFEELSVAEEELRAQQDELIERPTSLTRERDHYRDLFEFAPVAYFSTDRHGVIREANRATAELLGCDSRFLAGKPIAAFVATDARPSFRRHLASVTAEKGAVPFLLTLTPRAGTRRHVTSSVRVVRRPSGELNELHWVLTDARDEDDDVRMLAEQSRQTVADLIARVSHELRTPIAAIGGYAEMLAMGLRGEVTASQLEAIQRIHQAQAHLAFLLDDLLAYFRLGSGRLYVNAHDVPIAETLTRAAAMMEPFASSKRIHLAIAASPVDAIAHADPERTSQIVLNLLSNALKFTPAGGRVELACSVLDSEVRVNIRDTGIGIPADSLEDVFEPFVQLKHPTSALGGLGLGLAISRELARAMDGDLIATSKPGEGSTFTLKLRRSTRFADR